MGVRPTGMFAIMAKRTRSRRLRFCARLDLMEWRRLLSEAGITAPASPAEVTVADEARETPSANASPSDTVSSTMLLLRDDQKALTGVAGHVPSEPPDT